MVKGVRSRVAVFMREDLSNSTCSESSLTFKPPITTSGCRLKHCNVNLHCGVGSSHFQSSGHRACQSRNALVRLYLKE